MRILKDSFGRVHDYLRVSVTDKCNLNCFYCNPDSVQNKLNKNEILSYSEILRIISLFVTKFGFKKIRLTGGEPFARKGIMEFISLLSQLKKEHPFILGLTTNGTLLKDNIDALKKAGVDNLNVSLDTLNKSKFFEINKGSDFDAVIASIDEALQSGFNSFKINTVIMKGVNDDELLDFTNYAKEKNVNVRFIEYMPFTNNSWNKDSFISYAEMKERIEKVFPLTPLPSTGITKDYMLSDFKSKISFISSVSEHFCSSCNRLRITSDGNMKLCLFSVNEGISDIKYLIRNNATDEELTYFIESQVSGKKFMHPDAAVLASYDGNFMRGIGG